MEFRIGARRPRVKITVLAIGRAQAEDAAMAAEYLKRLGKSVAAKEIAASKNLPAAVACEAEAERLLALIPAKAFAVLLDERGKDLSSREFAAKLAAWQERGQDIIFVIGGADGVTDEVRGRADFTLAFGKLTWPHRLARVMLLEQLYRARQINAGHPYHRD
jgi:23S rRNA (pseudouridine1915-N3)-methyltransferase